MIDNFALMVSHGLILLAAWRLIGRPDLDDDGAVQAPRLPFLSSASKGKDGA
jgi:hypothetical protein